MNAAHSTSLGGGYTAVKLSPPPGPWACPRPPQASSGSQCHGPCCRGGGKNTSCKILPLSTYVSSEPQAVPIPRTHLPRITVPWSPLTICPFRPACPSQPLTSGSGGPRGPAVLLLRLASCTAHSTDHPCGCKGQDFLPFKGRIAPHLYTYAPFSLFICQ